MGYDGKNLLHLHDNRQGPPTMPHRTQCHSLAPEGSFDTHVHVFDPSIGPYAASRAYTPPDASLDDLISFSSSLSESGSPLNLVLVQPSPYGTDNSVLMHCLDRLNTHSGIVGRGIAVVDVSSVAHDELLQMHRAGVRGLRINLQADGAGVDLARLKSTLLVAAERVRELPGWRLQIYAPAAVWADLHDFVWTLPVEIIADHLGGLLGGSKLEGVVQAGTRVDATLSQPGIERLLDLARHGRVWIKVSGLYRASTRVESGYDDLECIIRHLFKEVPDRLIWASDWPHTGEGKARAGKDPMSRLSEVEQFRTVDDLAILQSIKHWAGEDDHAWRDMMVNNPRKLFCAALK